MQHTYKITGMTCTGCQVKVKYLLEKVEGVESASVDLDKGEAVVTMHTHIETGVFQKALSEKYTIEEKKQERNVFASSAVAEEKTSKIKQLKPLFLILLYITIASALLHSNPWDTSGFMLDFMGLFFIVFSFFKMLDLKGFQNSFAMYDPLANKLPFYGILYPFLETALGLLFLMRVEITGALFATLFVLGITTIGVTKTLLSKKTIQCACLGTALKLPMTLATFIENAIMIVMSVWMLIELL